MFIQSFSCGPFQTNAYIAVCVQTHDTVIIDPAPDSFNPIQAYILENKLSVKKILLTHSHWDHIADVKKVKEKYGVPVYVHALDTDNLQKPGADGLPCWIIIPSTQPDHLMADHDQITLGHLNFQVIHTPGHSPGSVCFYEPQQKTLFSGDTLFKGSIGNICFPTSQPDLMWPSLAKLSLLPAETKVFPGHGSATTLLEESSWLPHAKELFSD